MALSAAITNFFAAGERYLPLQGEPAEDGKNRKGFGLLDGPDGAQLATPIRLAPDGPRATAYTESVNVFTIHAQS